MSRYDGLNLPQLMDLMHGLVMPDPVPWSPETPGWWILFGWLLGMLFISGYYFVQQRRRNRYRRQALAVLSAIDRQADLHSAESAQRIAALLKRTALAAYPRQQVASLFGGEWAKFLVETTNHDRQVAEAADRLAAAAYRDDADGRALIAPARRWIRLHRA